MIGAPLLGPPKSENDPAIVELFGEGRAYSYQETFALAASFAEYYSPLISLCTSPFVVLFFENEASFFFAVLGCQLLGKTVVPVSAKSGFHRLKNILRVTGAELVFSSIRPPEYLIHAGVRWEDVSSLDFSRLGKKAPDYIEGSREPVCLFTSGSSGDPKGVVYSKETTIFFAENIRNSTGLHPNNRELLLSTVCHSDGWQRAFATMRGGGAIFLLGQNLPVFQVPNLIANYGITSLFLPAPLMPIFLAGGSQIQGLRFIELGSVPISENAIHSLLKSCPDSAIHLHYGLTECSRAFTLDCRENPEKLSTVGKCNSGIVAKVENGQLLLKSSFRPRKRFANGKLQVDSDEWLATGDSGKIDKQGFLTLYGRSDSMISVGGYHIYPNEIRKCLEGFEPIKDFEVLSEKSESPAGSKMRILIVAHEAEASELSLRREIAESLPGYLSSSLEFVPMIRRDSSGKYLAH